jgi:hypothetical protein
MNTDDFEKKMQRQPVRPVPAEWRAHILKTANAAAIAPRPTKDSQPLPWWREFLLLWRWHLAGMSAAWVIIAILNIGQSAAPTTTTAAPNTASPQQLVTALQENRRQLLELIGPAVTEAAPPPRRLDPPRRSQLQSPNAMA